MSARHRACRGFTLVEMVVSLLIVSVMFVVALNTTAASRVGLAAIGERARARLVAEALMSEILQQPYWDPVAQGGLGPAPEETVTGNRSLFDDVDDYDGWTAAPPQLRDGTEIAGLPGWEREVEVNWVAANDLETPRGSELGLKRIVVRVRRGSLVLAELHAIRANLEAAP